MVHGAEPPVLVVVGGRFFFGAVVLVSAVDAGAVGAFGEVGDGIDTWAAVLVSPLESEPQPVGAASSPAAPNIKRRDRPTRIGPAL
jgi:hypothetical protein